MDYEINNQAIAIFDGRKKFGSMFYMEEFECVKYGEGSNSFRPEELMYHLSWDWLMPVVRKINGNGYALEGLALVVKIHMACSTADINLVYMAVVAFVDWDNENE